MFVSRRVAPSNGVESESDSHRGSPPRDLLDDKFATPVVPDYT